MKNAADDTDPKEYAPTLEPYNFMKRALDENQTKSKMVNS